MPTEGSQKTLGNASEERLSGSVGKNGVNQKADVLLVQQLINDHLPVGLAPLLLNGVCDDATIAAITEFQRRILHFNFPDGRVDPDGRTFRALTGATAAPKPHPGSPVPEDVIAAAQASHDKWKIPASVTLAQWALESGWGRKMPLGSNNPFGIKAASGQAFVEAITREHINGQGVTI